MPDKISRSKTSIASTTIPWRNNLLLILTGIASAVLISFCIKYGHEWGGDFALYIAQSQALIDGTIDDLYEVNKYSMQHSMYEVGPYLYPNGFPLLMCPLIAWKGIHFVLLKWFCAVLFIASLPFVYRLFHGHFKTRSLTYIITTGVFLHAGYITFCDNILSDLPYFLFSFLSLCVIESSGTRASQVLLGCVIFFTFFIRDIGIVLIPTLLTWQWMNYRTRKLHSKDWIGLLIPYFCFAILLIGSRLLLPNGGENHLAKIFNRLSFDNVISNSGDYFELITEYFHVHSVVSGILLILALIGMIAERKKYFHWIVFVLGSLMVVLIWPHFQGIRFLFVLLPFTLFFLLRGILLIFDRQEKGNTSLQVCIWAGLVYMMIFSGIEISRYHKRDMNFAYTPEMREIYTFITGHVPKDKIIGFEKPRVLRLFTGVNAILSDLEFFGSSEADLLLIHRQHAQHAESDYHVLYESDNYYLLERKMQ